jgi:hypothetical protein
VVEEVVEQIILFVHTLQEQEVQVVVELDL